MKDLAKIKRVWNELTPFQTLSVRLLVLWYLITNTYADFPYALRRWFFNRELYNHYPAHWIR